MLDNIKQTRNPFNLYDFFGYLFPGFIFVTGIFALIFKITPKSFSEVCYQTVRDYKDLHFFIGLVIFTFIVIGIYVIGHIIAAIGSLIIDRIYMRKIFQDPYSYLLRLEKKKINKVFFYFVSIFGIINFYFLIEFVLSIISIINFLSDHNSIIIYTSLTIMKYFVLTVFLIFIFWFVFFKSNTISSDEKLNVFQKFVVEVMLKILKWIQVFVNNNKPLPEEIITQFKQLFREKFDLEPEKLSNELSYLPYYYVSNSFPTFDARLNNWHYLYAFSRNLFSACIIFCFSCSIITFCRPADIYYHTIYFISFILGAIFYIRYLNLFQDYYIRNIFRTFVTAGCIKKEEFNFQKI